MDNHPSQNLTVAGRILVFLTLLAALAGTWAAHEPLFDLFAGSPWGTFYLFPGIMAALVFYCAGATFCRVFGIRILKQQPID